MVKFCIIDAYMYPNMSSKIFMIWILITERSWPFKPENFNNLTHIKLTVNFKSDETRCDPIWSFAFAFSQTEFSVTDIRIFYTFVSFAKINKEFSR